MNTYYFDPTELLEEKTREILNMKLERITNDYNQRLIGMHERNQVLSSQIQTYEKTLEFGHLSIHDMTCDKMVSKLSVVEKDPDTIWTCIE